MEKLTGILLLIAVAFRLLVLFFFFAKHLFNPAFHFYFYRGNDHCHYTVDKEMASLAKLEIKSITAIYSLS